MDLKCLVYLFAVFSLIQSESDQEVPERIIGGKPCKLKQFPYVVFLKINPNMIGIGGGRCTGSIIASKWVITAAHCYQSKTDEGADLNKIVTTVIAGTVNYKDKTEERQERTSVRHIVHERNPVYGNKLGNQDIALVEVGQPFNLTEFVDTITMAKFPREAVKVPSISVGFGLTNMTDPFGNTRMFYINTTATDFMFCKKSIWYDALRAEHLCMDSVKEGTETAPGDSGGPLAYRRFHVGVLAGQKPINKTYFYQVYSKVSYFEDWIRQHVPEIPPMEQLSLEIDEPRSEKRSSASSATVAGVSVLTIAFWLSILVGSDRTSA